MTKLSENHFSSMHVYFDKLAKDLNDAGYDVVRFINLTDNQFKLPWNKDLIKELWRIVQISQTDKKSTTEITPYEAIKIHQILDQKVAELTGVSVGWPNKKNRRRKQEKIR